MKQLIDQIITHKEQIGDTDNGWIGWDDIFMGDAEQWVKDNPYKFMNTLDDIILGKYDDRTKVAALEVYRLIHRTNICGAITSRLRATCLQTLNGPQSEVRNEMVYVLSDICNGVNDELLQHAYDIETNSVKKNTIRHMILDFERHDEFPKEMSDNIISVALWLFRESPYNEVMEYLMGQGITKDKIRNQRLRRLLIIAERGDAAKFAGMVDATCKSKYKSDNDCRVMASYVKEVPEIWDRCVELKKYA